MRVWDWVEKLHTTVAAASRGETPFNYGTYNCGAFSARCIDVMVEGSNREEELCSHFTDEASCKAWVESQGGIEAVVTARLGEPLSSWTRATRGDVCLMPTQDGPGIGVNMGTGVAMLTPTGVGYIRIEKALKCWTVN